MKCPKCGGEGGVQLFMSVAPCDRCAGTSAAKAGTRRWVKLWPWNGNVPSGVIGWSAAQDEATAEKRIADEPPIGAGVPVPDSIVVIRFGGPGGTRLMKPSTIMQAPGWKYPYALVED